MRIGHFFVFFRREPDFLRLSKTDSSSWVSIFAIYSCCYITRRSATLRYDYFLPQSGFRRSFSFNFLAATPVGYHGQFLFFLKRRLK